MKKYKVLDLFSGTGGLTLGFVQNNYKIMESVDNFQSTANTYNLNYNKPTKIKDITDPDINLHKIEMIKKINPYVFVLENVKGISSFKDGDGIFIIDKIIDMLKNIGYYSYFIFLRSKLNILKQIGNSVPVKMSNKMAKLVKEGLLGG